MQVMQHGAEGAILRAVPGDRLGRRRRRPRAPAGADLLARRRRAAHHLGPDRHARPAQDAPEPRHLPAAGDRAQQGDHALAGARAAARSIFATTRSRIPGTPFPIAVALGADPATILGAVTPVPDTLSEYQFAGLLRGARTEIVKCLVARPAGAGVGGDRARGLHPSRRRRSDRLRDALEGPFGDHTGYYNEVERFPGVDDRAHHDAARSDLPLDLHRQAARRARRCSASR